VSADAGLLQDDLRLRPLAPSDSIVELTLLLHRAYARLGAMGLNYTAVDQSPDVTARRLGSVTHRWLQRIAEEGLEKWSAERIHGLAKVIRANLAASGVGAADLDAATQGVERALVNAVEDERGRWILGAHAQTHNEHRLTSAAGGVRRQLVIDRHFVEADGTRWVIDYKTSRHEGADPEGFLDRERERYRPQLARYGALFAEGSRQGLYFVLMPGWREVP